MIVLLLLPGGDVHAQVSRDITESSLRLPTAQVLPPDSLQGPGYVIDESVGLADNRFQFRVKTDYGGFAASGISMLELRLREHFAIESLRRSSRDLLILKGVASTIQDTPDGVRTLLSDPLGSLKRIPSGINRNTARLLDPLERRAGSTARRQLAVSVGADPETRNPVLSRLLTQMAVRKDIGRIAAKTGLSFAVPGLGFLSTTEEFRQIVATRGPREIAESLRPRLRSLGVSDKASSRFLESQFLTSSEKMLFVQSTRQLRGVTGIDSLVLAASDSKTESHLLSLLEQMQMLGRLHERDVIASVGHFRIPIARMKDSRLIGVASADILYDAAALKKDVDEFRKRATQADVTLLLKGNITSDARDVFREADIPVLRFNPDQLSAVSGRANVR